MLQSAATALTNRKQFTLFRQNEAMRDLLEHLHFERAHGHAADAHRAGPFSRKMAPRRENAPALEYTLASEIILAPRGKPVCA